jgi:hypothetical protein
MFLPNEAVKEFQEIYKEKCGIELSEGEARIEAEGFLNLMDLITKPTPKKKDDQK